MRLAWLLIINLNQYIFQCAFPGLWYDMILIESPNGLCLTFNDMSSSTDIPMRLTWLLMLWRYHSISNMTNVAWLLMIYQYQYIIQCASSGFWYYVILNTYSNVPFLAFDMISSLNIPLCLAWSLWLQHNQYIFQSAWPVSWYYTISNTYSNVPYLAFDDMSCSNHHIFQCALPGL